jgi:hypothetical protein
MTAASAEEMVPAGWNSADPGGGSRLKEEPATGLIGRFLAIEPSYSHAMLPDVR